MQSYCLAYSGGLDSHVLLALFCELREQSPIQLRAIHVHHGLSPHADAWAAHCRQVCDAFGVEFLERRVTLALDNGESLEEVAREARYAVFAETLREGEILLTAHHQDDQAETLLLQLLRGAGPKGLSAMPQEKPFAKGWHKRPLLGYSREALHQYAVERGLRWIEDESNQNAQLSRNFIRHQVLPLLKTQWPSAESALARSAAHCGEAQALLEEYALSDCEKIKGTREDTLSVKGLLALSPEKQRLMLRTWIHRLGYPLPDTRKMASIQATVLTAAPDRMPCVKWGEVELRRYRNDLYVLQGSLRRPLSRPGKLGIAQEVVAGEGRGEGAEDLHAPSIRYRCGGERLYIPKRGNLSLKNLFQEWGVPPWERDKIPLVYEGERLVGVVGYFMPEKETSKNKTRGQAAG